MEANIYSQTGKEVGKITLPANVFGLGWNADLVHQVSVSMMSNLRAPVAHVKDRGAVRGGGKKPWRQKGTGRARHGSSRSPLWVGGGVTHGPSNEKVFARKINKGMKAKALRVALSKKFKDGEILFVENLSFKTPKTKDAKVVLDSLAAVKGFEYITKKKENVLHLALAQKEVAVEKSFRNFNTLSVGELRNLNVLDVLNKKYLIIVNPAEALKLLESKA